MTPTGTDVAVRKFSPTTLPDRIAFAKYLATAGMLPRAYRNSPGDILLAMEFGDSLGIPTVQAMSTINVIEGKPSASAALISALVRRAGHRLRVWGDGKSATATIIRSDDPDFEYKAEWDLERAQEAGLVKLVNGKPRARSATDKILPWEAYTAALLKARAVTEVARDACQEALMGVQYTPEELGANVDGSGTVVEPILEENRVQSRGERATPAAAADEVVDAELVEGPQPERVIPLTLPEDFDAIVQACEESLDLEGLRDLRALAIEADNRLAVGATEAAGIRAAAAIKARDARGAAIDATDQQAVA